VNIVELESKSGRDWRIETERRARQQSVGLTVVRVAKAKGTVKLRTLKCTGRQAPNKQCKHSSSAGNSKKVAPLATTSGDPTSEDTPPFLFTAWFDFTMVCVSPEIAGGEAL
jgi:hypothetical protein